MAHIISRIDLLVKAMRDDVRSLCKSHRKQMLSAYCASLFAGMHGYSADSAFFRQLDKYLSSRQLIIKHMTKGSGLSLLQTQFMFSMLMSALPVLFGTDCYHENKDKIHGYIRHKGHWVERTYDDDDIDPDHDGMTERNCVLIIVASRQFGKTFAATIHIAAMMLGCDRIDVLLIAQCKALSLTNMNDVRSAILTVRGTLDDAVINNTDHLKFRANPGTNSSPMDFSTLQCKVGNPNNIRGVHPNIVWMDEFEFQPEAVFTSAVLPLMSKEGRALLMTSTHNEDYYIGNEIIQRGREHARVINISLSCKYCKEKGPASAAACLHNQHLRPPWKNKGLRHIHINALAEMDQMSFLTEMVNAGAGTGAVFTRDDVENIAVLGRRHRINPFTLPGRSTEPVLMIGVDPNGNGKDAYSLCAMVLDMGHQPPGRLINRDLVRYVVVAIDTAGSFYNDPTERGRFIGRFLASTYTILRNHGVKVGITILAIEPNMGGGMAHDTAVSFHLQNTAVCSQLSITQPHLWLYVHIPSHAISDATGVERENYYCDGIRPTTMYSKTYYVNTLTWILKRGVMQRLDFMGNASFTPEGMEQLSEERWAAQRQQLCRFERIPTSNPAFSKFSGKGGKHGKDDMVMAMLFVTYYFHQLSMGSPKDPGNPGSRTPLRIIPFKSEQLNMYRDGTTDERMANFVKTAAKLINGANDASGPPAKRGK